MKLSLTAQCVLALLLGILVGTAAARLQPDALSPWLGVAEGTIQIWTNALRLVVVPFVLAQLFVAIASSRAARGDATKLGIYTPVVFVGLLAFTALCTVVLGSVLLRAPGFRGLSLGGLPAAPQAGLPAAPDGGTPFAWVTALVPSNLFAALTTDAILPLMLFTLAFALAARRLAPPLRQALETGFQAVRDAMFMLVEWLLVLAPVALFALAFRSASRFGLEIGGVLLAFVVLWAIVLVFCIAMQYPVAVFGGGIPLARYARALFPAQVAAATTRSSLATLPVLLHEADTTLGIPSRISSLVLPAGGSALKLSQAVSPPLRLLFLSQVLGISVGPQRLLVFLVAIALLSPSIAGIPRVISSQKSLPAYVAAGIPPEYVLLLAPLNAVVDILLTVLNTTGYQTANVVIARLLRSKSDPAAERPVAEALDGLPAAHPPTSPIS